MPDGEATRHATHHLCLSFALHCRYGHLFYHLQRDPGYLARLAPHVQTKETDNFIRTVVLTLFGDQYENKEERQLLQLFQQVSVCDSSLCFRVTSMS